MERHRLLWLFLERRTNLFTDFAGNPLKKMLHVAPEKCFEPRLRRLIGSSYLTADWYEEGVDVRMDITDIQFQDKYFDVIYCSHVLEHVTDDRKAMRELFRVLKHYGWAILLVPITSDRTFEDPSITDPKERLRLFGQEDHVRTYGPDYIERLHEAGFKVDCVHPTDFLAENEIIRMGITAAAGEIYFCQKPGAEK